MGGISSRTNRVFMFSSVRLEMPSALQGPYSGQAMAKPPADQAARQARGQANRSSTIIASRDSMARDWVPDTAFGRGFLSTDMWLQRVLARAVPDLNELAGTHAPHSCNRCVDSVCGRG